MCGIFGVVGRTVHDGLREAALTLQHRGPDGFGEWVSGDRTTYFAHCRLAIIDLSDAGRQPMGNADGSLQLTYNGEIYNFQELRDELVAKGYRFRSHTDSEVILHGYAEWGADIVVHLRGMFAFALWDEGKRHLVLARDRLGVKPLFYALRGRELAFASETRALLPVTRTAHLDVDAMFQYLRRSYIGGAHTIWAGISRLPPASVLVFDADRGTATMRRYWNYRDPDEAWSETGALEELQDLLASAVREELVSDVPVGVFLSGGIDSSLVAAFAARTAPKIDSFFVDFAGWSGSERGDAEAAAQHLETHHQVTVIDRDAFGLADPEQARGVFSAFDEPLADPAIVPTWHLAKHMRKRVTVALSGDGGDELFGGYTWYRQVRATRRRRAAWGIEALRRRLGMGREWPAGCANQHEYYHLLHCPSFTRSELATLFPQWTKQVNEITAGIGEPPRADSDTDRQRHWQELDLRTYLVDNNLARVDRASMAHSLEVRVPLLDHRIVELAMSLPDSFVEARPPKALLRAIARSVLPARLHEKPKQGFSFPLHHVIENGAMISAVREGVLVRHRWIDRSGLQTWLTGLPPGDHAFKLWLLFVLEQWARRWLTRAEAAAA